MKGVVGLQTVDLAGTFSKPFCVEAARVIGKSDAALIVFPGQNYNREGFSFRAFNIIYNFMTRPVVDSLILGTGTFFNFTSPENMRRIGGDLLSRVRLVSLEIEMEGADNFIIDNESGIKRCVEHLVIKHGCRRIGFIRGPDSNPEANQRFEAWQEALTDFGLEPPPGCVFKGDFYPGSGAEAVRDHIELIRSSLDGLVCANDYLALGALETLTRAGLKIPGDLAVTGFDDLEEVRFLRVPLTTVHQPLASIGRLAAQRALERLGGPGLREPETVTLSADLRVRGSCGCSPAREKQIFLEKYADVLTRRSLLDDFIRLELSPYLRDEDLKRLSGEIFRLIRDLLENSPTEEMMNGYLDRMEQCITGEIHDQGVELDWQEVISLVHTVSRKLSPYHLLWSHMDFFQRARIIAGEKMEQFQGLKRLRQERELLEPLRALTGRLLESADRDEVFAHLEQGLGSLGIETCLIALFEEGEPVSGLFTPYPSRSRLVYACANHQRRILPAEGIPFSTGSFFPQEYYRPLPGGRYVLLPLLFRRRIQGLILFSLSDRDYVANEEIRQAVSAALCHTGTPGLEGYFDKPLDQSERRGP